MGYKCCSLAHTKAYTTNYYSQIMETNTHSIHKKVDQDQEISLKYLKIESKETSTKTALGYSKLHSLFSDCITQEDESTY